MTQVSPAERSRLGRRAARARWASTEWKLPPYDPQQAKELLAQAGYAGGFDVRENPMVTLYTPDGPDVMEAVALG
jgi:ABC-type transport system substrate-binding protein